MGSSRVERDILRSAINERPAKNERGIDPLNFHSLSSFARLSAI